MKNNKEWFVNRATDPMMIIFFLKSFFFMTSPFDSSGIETRNKAHKRMIIDNFMIFLVLKCDFFNFGIDAREIRLCFEAWITLIQRDFFRIVDIRLISHPFIYQRRYSQILWSMWCTILLDLFWKRDFFRCVKILLNPYVPLLLYFIDYVYTTQFNLKAQPLTK